MNAGIKNGGFGRSSDDERNEYERSEKKVVGARETKWVLTY
jgi:hypothetical protein